MKHNKKTNAARKLDDLKISYRIMEYPVDEEHLDAVHVAAEVGMPAGQVFKTLVVRGDKKRRHVRRNPGRRGTGPESAGQGQRQ